MLAGLGAGLVAAFAMDRFQAIVSSLSAASAEGEPATEQAADRAARAVTGRPVPEAVKPIAGQVMHYALGAALGVGYGAAAEFYPEVTSGGGAALGVVTAALLDEAAVPALGFGGSPLRTPPATHIYTLASHLVFGVATEGARRLARRALA